MPRFLVIDQFLKDYQGHHLGYSLAVAEAARAEGLTPVIVANRALRVRVKNGICPLEPWFDHPGHGEAPALSSFPWRLWSLKAGVEHLLLLACRRNPAFFHLWREFNRLCSPRRPNAWRPAWPEPLRAVARTVRALWVSHKGRTPNAAHHFALQLGAALDRHKADPADHVLLHTVTFAELIAVRDELALREPATLPRIHIVLRNDPELDPPSDDLGRSLEGFCTAGLWPARVAFYSDTPELVGLYNGFSQVRFHELPIPLWHAHGGNGDGRDEAQRKDGPLRAAYLGDARPEKGYQWLPGLVQDLWPDLIRPGRLSLTIQSNFNLPGGEPGIAEARNQLLQFPQDRVRVLMEPLADDDYRRILEESDLLILPYDAIRYRARSSGVVAEALALGKPIVAPAGSWLTAHSPAGAIATFTHPADLGDAVRTALANHGAMVAAARAAAAAWRDRHNAGALVRTLLTVPLRCAAVESRPAVLYVMDADAFIFKTGSSSVARNQLDYLQRCGYRVFGVFLSMDVANPAYNENQWQRALDRALPAGTFARTWLVSYSPRPAGFPQALRMLGAVRRGEYSFDRAAALYDGLDIPADLHRLARTTPLAGVLINYVPALRLVERLGLAERPVLCETHDIQAFQYAHYGRRSIDAGEFERECRLLDRCAAVITLNELEADTLAPHLRRAALFDIRPLLNVAPVRVGELAGFADPGELTRACGLESGREAVVERLGRESHIDLLYVSTAHWPNIVSFRWFYETIYRPHLADQGITLVVAGNIDHGLSDIAHPRVFFTGRVDDLRPLYAAARLVVLPIRMGAGFNIKTMEALAYGKPVVATGFAVRSLDQDGPRLPVHDEPESFTARIRELLSDSTARADAAALALAVALVNNRPDRYDGSMNRACHAAWGAEMPQVPVRPVPEMPKRALCEWSMTVQHVNRHRHDLDGATDGGLRSSLENPVSWDVAAELWSALGGGDFTDHARRRLGVAPPSASPSSDMPRFMGYTEGVMEGCVTGWLLDRWSKGQPATVEVVEDGRVIARAIADQARSDLKALELGLGGHGFRERLPVGMFDGRERTLHIRPQGSDDDLPGSPVVIRLDRGDAILGHVDGVADGHVCGWAWDTLSPDARVRLEIRVNGVTLAGGVADQPRLDLEAAGIGDGRHGFRLPLPAAAQGERLPFVTIVPANTTRPLPGGFDRLSTGG